jgi:hypothetical protein
MKPELRLVDISEIQRDWNIDTIFHNGGRLYFRANPPSVYSNSIFYYKTDKNLYRIEKGEKGFNSYMFETIGDSLIVFYLENQEREFGDFWFVKKKDSINYLADNMTNDSNHKWSVFYSNGKLIRIDNQKVEIDSIYVKSHKNNIYRIESNQLKFYSSFEKYDIKKFENGLYYFAYPGRKIEYVLKFDKYK